MTDQPFDVRMKAIEDRLDAHEKRSQEILNRIMFQQERFDQVINMHSNMIESMDTTVELFMSKEICLREWFMKQVDENRKFTSSIVVKLVGVFTALALGIIGIIKFVPG